MIHLQIETCKLQIDSQSVYIMVLTYISSSLKLKREMRHNRTFDNNRSSLIHSNYSSLGNFLSQFTLRTTSNRGEKSAFTITKRRSVNLARSSRSIIDSIPVSKSRTCIDINIAISTGDRDGGGVDTHYWNELQETNKPREQRCSPRIITSRS